MSDVLFTQLPVAVALTGQEVVPVDQPNAAPPGTFTTKRTTTGAIAALASTQALRVQIITDAAYTLQADDAGSLLSFSNASPVAVTLPVTGEGLGFLPPTYALQIENRGAGAVTLTPSGGATIDGDASLVLIADQGVVLAVGPDLNWYTQRGAGLTAATVVTSVGLALPVSVFTVSGSPVTTTGTLTGTLVAQAANRVWAGPATGVDAAPTFRALVTNDLPDYGTASTYGSATAVPVITTDAKGRVTATTAAIVPGSITNVPASSLLGNPTGAPAAASAITLGATLAFSGTALQSGAATGDVTWSANSYVTTIAANAVTFAKFQQVAGLSVVGRAANTTGDTAAITAASDGQVLRRSGTSIGFGAIDLTSANAVTGALTVPNGGTGATSFTAYGVVLGGTTTTGALQTVSGVGTAGQALTSQGAGLAPTWAAVGNVVGPGSATDNAAARFDLTTGKLIQNSALIIADTTAALSRSGAGGIAVQGTNTNDNAASGDIGEYIESEVLIGSPVSLTTSVAANVTSISLTAGDWDVWGSVGFTVGATTQIATLGAAINTTSATLPTGVGKGAYNLMQTNFTTGNAQLILAGQRRLSLSSTTTVYLIGYCTFSVSTAAAYGVIAARRVR